jgi:3-deoxy-D-arabino-heptulosonate 7-phosphate (DAHP) synthase
MNSHISKMVIAGPCALESREQLRDCVRVLKQIGISMIRASLWKPRTQPGWEGLGWMSLPLLLEETIPHNMIPATEILCTEHAHMVVHALQSFGKDAKMLVWLGARNQNHIEQTKIAQILASGPKGLLFMFKNQMWDDERHWIGIFEHIISTGFPKDRLLICHRGFCPGKLPNPKKFRNIPDFEMAMRIKEKTGLPMLFDPSHIGGSVKNVIHICEMAKHFNFDGCLIEMHPTPEKAKTDSHQQLSPEELRELLRVIGAP